ncbi:type IV secretion system protein [Glacieibacterium frigidum]|uniref:Type IV secretion system protein n=1 Tax=Glacieibacterium frigidum TaxID=2593303 RepID=A0A552UH28_9SPHN|nr:type IV secretion system protein [Glacieibacterium frigidum]TRW17516.1 type IV secretion system protein [Glacieibacterium frigidum]
MIDACAATFTGDTPLRDVLAGADCLIRTQVEQGYAALLAPGGSFATALTIALTIYVAVFGYRLMLGLSSLTLGEVVPHFVKIGLVVALASSWPSYQALVFDLLFDGPEQLADVIVRQAGGPAGQGETMLALQAVFERLTDAAADAWAQVAPVAVTPPAPVVPGAPPAVAPPAAVPLPFALGASQFVAAILWSSALVLVAASVGVLLVVRIVLALLLVLGPVFIAFALFRSTRGVAEGWLRVTVRFALVPLFALPMIAVVVAVLAPVVATLDAPVEAVRDSPALLILLVVAVFAAVMWQAAKLGRGIAAGIRLPRGGPAPVPEPPRAATPMTADERVLTATRAQTIVAAIDAGNRRTAPGSIGTTPAAIVATRSIAGPATEVRTTDVPRLGQTYRRLAVAVAPRR